MMVLQMRWSWRYQILVVIAVTIVSGLVCADEMTMITMADHCEVNADTILLGDLAQITGSDEALNAQVRTIAVGAAPQPGKSRSINRDYVIIRLKQSGVSLTAIAFQGPEVTIVSRGSVEITAEKLERVVREFIVQNMPWDQKKVHIADVRITDPVRLPQGHIGYTVLPPEGGKYQGTVLIPITFTVNGASVKKVWAHATIEVLTDVVVCTRPLGRYEIITEDKIRIEQKDLASIPSNALAAAQDVVGKRTRRVLSANAVLTADQVELPPLMKRGDLVTIIADSGCLRISARGEALERGRRGELIKIRNLSSQKEIFGRVIDGDTVAVDF